MRIEPNNPPRVFVVGDGIPIRDCGTIALEANEQLTFLTESGAQYDVARKDWGFYATPSLDGRLAEFRLRAVIVQNHSTKKYFILLVEHGHEASFEAYLDSENLRIVSWIDSDDACLALDRKVSGGA